VDSSAWDERYAASEPAWSAAPNQFVERELADLEPGRALDLASGEGRNARWLAERGWQVTAMDFSPVAIEKARNLHDAVNWQVGDALTAKLPEHLDLVVVAYLQIVPEERTTVLRRAFGSLRSGGRLLVVAHDSTNLTEGTGGPQDPTVLFTAENVTADLADARFDVVRAERVAREVPSPDDPDSTRTAWDALVHLVRS